MSDNIAPQDGPQREFLATPADFALYGGAAGGGKTFALLLEGLRGADLAGYNGMFFRRTMPEINNPGGLWDEAVSLYPLFGGIPKRSPKLHFKFPVATGEVSPKLTFGHMQYEDTKYNYQGSQIAFIGFDEITHFSESQVTYMLSRNRSTSGMKPYMRGTCNPDPDSFVRRWIDWYIGPDGYPIPERAGALRYFLKMGDDLLWFKSLDEVKDRHPEKARDAKSFTFIPANIYDNQILLENDPQYLSNLRALSRVDRERLEKGNWNIRPLVNRIAHAFDEDIHVKEFTRKGFPVWVGQDFNVSPMTSVVGEVVGDTVFIFDELVLGLEGRSNTYEATEELFKRFGRCNICPDSTGGSHRSSAKETDLTILSTKHNVKGTLNPYREDRFNCMNGLFENRRIVIHPKCKHLIAALNNFEDTKKTENHGHIIDAFGYLLWYLFPLRTKLGQGRSFKR